MNIQKPLFSKQIKFNVQRQSFFQLPQCVITWLLIRIAVPVFVPFFCFFCSSAPARQDFLQYCQWDLKFLHHSNHSISCFNVLLCQLQSSSAGWVHALPVGPTKVTQLKFLKAKTSLALSISIQYTSIKAFFKPTLRRSILLWIPSWGFSQVVVQRHHSGDGFSYKVDPLKVVLLLPTNVQSKEVAVIDNWSVFPHFGQLLY